MTMIDPALMCKKHRVLEGAFIVVTMQRILNEGVGILREERYRGRFDARMASDRLHELIKFEGRKLPRIHIPFHRSDYLGYIHGNGVHEALRRVCAECRLLIDNDARRRGRLMTPIFIRRRRAQSPPVQS